MTASRPFPSPPPRNPVSAPLGVPRLYRAVSGRRVGGVAVCLADYLHLPHANDPLGFLDTIHLQLSVGQLNALRMHVIAGLNAEPWLRPTYFRLARSTIETIVGNELCMQRRINLSIQMPADDSSLLATHSDVWSGHSAFEVGTTRQLVAATDGFAPTRGKT